MRLGDKMTNLDEITVESVLRMNHSDVVKLAVRLARRLQKAHEMIYGLIDRLKDEEEI